METRAGTPDTAMSDTSPPTGTTAGQLIGPHDGTPIEVELFVRSIAPFGTRATLDALVDRLDTLSEVGIIEALSVEVWGDSLRTDGPTAEDGREENLVDRVLDMFEFAADSECSIGRYFRIATDGSLVDTDSRRRLVPPHRCLTIRRDGDLVAVFPCDLDSLHLTPDDAVEYLESGRSERELAGPTPG